MKYNPTIHTSKLGKTITRIPKSIAIIASIGFETVTPIFFSPLSIVSVISCSSLETTYLQFIHKGFLVHAAGLLLPLFKKKFMFSNAFSWTELELFLGKILIHSEECFCFICGYTSRVGTLRPTFVFDLQGLRRRSFSINRERWIVNAEVFARDNKDKRSSYFDSDEDSSS